MKSIIKNLLVALGFISLMGMLAFFAIVVLIAKNLGSGDIPSMMGDSKNQVGIVELQGEISSSKDIREKLEKFVKDDKIKAIVIAIDSPGGAVGASEEIYKYIVEDDNHPPYGDL